MRVENRGAVPLKLAADARLVVLEVTPPGGKKAVRCELPADMRPGPEERALVLPPQRAYAEVFDPRLYCFGAKEEAALVPGASVVAHLGWPNARKVSPPFVVEPLEGVSPPVAAAKEIAAPEWTIPQPTTTGAPTATAPPARAPEELDPNAPKIVLIASPREDAYDARGATVTVTVLNHSAKPVPLLLRPETVSFDVVAPDGSSQRCGSVHPVDAPIRELYTTVPARGRESLRVLVGDICPERPFDQPGLYTIRPELDTRQASGRPVGLRTFDGVAPAPLATHLRVRHARKPSLPRRPTLE
jgi:hypothetical protein